MTFKSTIFVCLLIGSAIAQGTVTSSSVVAATVSGLVTAASTTAGEAGVTTIYGGFAGASGGCTVGTTSATSTCNSCSAPQLSNICTSTIGACAERSIHPDLNLTVQMVVDSVPTNPVLLAQWTSGETTQISVQNPSGTPGSNGQPFEVQVKWGDICTRAGMGASCADSAEGSGDLTVGLAESGSSTTFAANSSVKFNVKIRYQNPDKTTGAPLIAPRHDENLILATDPFTDFEVFPGDEKAFVQDIWRGSTGPTSSIKWNALRIYYAEVTGAIDFCTIPLNGGNFTTLEVNDKTNVKTALKENNNKITGLTNEVEYMFTGASVDETSIVMGFLDPSSMAMTDATIQKRYIARPGEVVGLLDGQQCFIATAAFGSSMDPHVDLLRKFRNQFLNTNEMGRMFVRFYYQFSPPIAELISQSEILRSVVRFALWPVIFLADLILLWGFWPLLGAFLLFSFSTVVTLRKVQRKI